MQLKHRPGLTEILISDELFEKKRKIETKADEIIEDLEKEGYSMDEIIEILNKCKQNNKKHIKKVLERRIAELQSSGEEEIWKSFPCDDRYAVSSFGRFRLPHNKSTFGSMCADTSYIIPPHTWKKIGSFVHIVVAKMFPELVENSGDDERIFVGHRDDVKYHNNASNLIWLTPQENSTWGNIKERLASKRGIPIRCIETGDTFPSMAHATEVMRQDPKYKNLHNISSNSLKVRITSHLKKVKGYSDVNGFHFEKIEY